VGCSPFALVPGPLGFDFYSAGFPGEVVAITAPWPVFGVFYEAALYGVAVDVLELLDVLAVGEDVEVVVAGLPELFAVAFEALGGFSLEDSHRIAEELLLRLGEQQVDVLRHEDVAEEAEIVRLTDSL